MGAGRALSLITPEQLLIPAPHGPIRSRNSPTECTDGRVKLCSQTLQLAKCTAVTENSTLCPKRSGAAGAVRSGPERSGAVRSGAARPGTSLSAPPGHYWPSVSSAHVSFASVAAIRARSPSAPLAVPCPGRPRPLPTPPSGHSGA